MDEVEQEIDFSEISPLVDAILEMSSEFVSKYRNFLPHGGFIDMTGKVVFCATAPENDVTSSVEVLPLLHDGLRQETAKWTTNAVAVSESVFIGERMTPAIKVLVEHRSGLTLAFYQTWRKRLFRNPVFGAVQVQEVEPEIGGWKLPVISLKS